MTEPPSNHATPAKILVTILILIAVVLTAALFMIPVYSAWFWPTAGGLVVVGAAAMLIPIRTRT